EPGAQVLVEDVEERDDLAVDVLRGSAGPGHAPPGDDDRADEAGGGVRDLVGVGGVGPQHRAFVVRAGTGPLRHGPDVGVLAALRPGVVGLVGPAGAVVVVRPLGGLVVEQAVGMHAGR